jgi:hypothetical protein
MKFLYGEIVIGIEECTWSTAMLYRYTFPCLLDAALDSFEAIEG